MRFSQFIKEHSVLQLTETFKITKFGDATAANLQSNKYFDYELYKREILKVQAPRVCT